MTSIVLLPLKSKKCAVVLGLITCFCVLLLSPFRADLLFADDPFLRRETEQESAADTVVTDGQSPEHNEGHAEATSKTKTARAKPFSGYGPYREQLLTYCKAITADGQYSVMQTVLEKLLKEKASCVSCRQLYKSLSCKVVKKSKDGKVMTPASTPSTELLAIISEIFTKISEDSELSAVTAQNLKPLLQELSIQRNVISDAYFEILVSYIQAPLIKELAEAEINNEKDVKKIKQKELQDLF